MYRFFAFPTFLNYWTNAEFVVSCDLLRRNPQCWSPIIFWTYGINLDSRMSDKLCAYLARVICCYNYCNLFHYASYRQAQWWNVSHLRQSSLFQTEIIKLWISLEMVLLPTLTNSANIWPIPGYLWLFISSIANSNAKALAQALVVLLCVCLCA